ncbi:transposase [Pseudogracilibacillus sp. ICA-222130]|uniref:transposase n=1 Tax=Pseudogracilibacillus sp. ICA-222130 TaxID=3134655 RepID=UPI0030BE34A3
MLKNYRCVITDVENKSIIDIVRKRNKYTVISYLSKRQDIDKIEFVAMDMWNPYKSAVNTVIPHAKIVIDKFHVVKKDMVPYQKPYQKMVGNVDLAVFCIK